MIDVLLATYRPDERFLEAQVSSIVAQEGVRVNLMTREDEEGRGACANFSKLLEASSADYVAFSDQDDVWDKHKLAKCLAMLRKLETEFGEDVPLLVFCDGYVTDANLNRMPGTVVSRQHVDVAGGLRFNRLLMQNFVAGNSMLFNAALREKAGKVPGRALMHDAWIVLVAAAFGHIGFVDEPLYFYRQHGKNVLGANDRSLRHFAKRAFEGKAAFRARLAGNVNAAAAFVERFGDASPGSARALASLPTCGWLERRLQICRNGLYKHGLIRNLDLMLRA